MSDEEKKEYEELKSLLYTGTISQYGKRKLIDIIEKQQKEIEELKEENEKYKNPPFFDEDNYTENDKIKAKIEPVLKQLERKMQEEYNKYGNSREYQDIVDAYNFLQSLYVKNLKF